LLFGAVWGKIANFKAILWNQVVFRKHKIEKSRKELKIKSFHLGVFSLDFKDLI